MGSTTTNWVSSALLALLTVMLAACQRDSVYAPVVDLDALPAVHYAVKKTTKNQVVVRVSQTNAFRHRANYMHAQTGWAWPAAGKIITYYSANHKGVNIAGKEGEPVIAAAAGEVVYAGNGLRGYGNLIIIKHNNQYLTAYAHNKALTVALGDWVKRGQKIAEMGHTDTNTVMLHFEVRRNGKPIDPLSIRGIIG